MIRVIGIGDNVVDKYIHTRMMYPGGNALNFSVYAKMLGGDAAYLGTLGNDAAAEHILKVMGELMIDISHCRQVEGENGYARVNLVDGDRVFLPGNKGGVQKQHPLVLSEGDMAYIQTFSLVHSSCYSYNMENQIQQIHNAGIAVSYDFSNHWENALLEKVCPYTDFSCFSCSHLSDQEIREHLERVHGLGSMGLATAGARGAVFYDGETFYHQEPNRVQAIDTLGAGDSFITAFLMDYLSIREEMERPKPEAIMESMRKGAAFAAQNCMVNGAFGYGLHY